MPDDYHEKIRRLATAKALAIASYGESVAAYRYRTLSERPEGKPHRAVFEEMADEEQEHHTRVQELQKKHFPDSDFVLTPEDKELVIVGHRMLDVSDRASFDRSLGQICESEQLTGRFYQALHDLTTHQELKPFLKEMADECVEHAERLKAISGTGAT